MQYCIATAVSKAYGNNYEIIF